MGEWITVFALKKESYLGSDLEFKVFKDDDGKIKNSVFEITKQGMKRSMSLEKALSPEELLNFCDRLQFTHTQLLKELVI